VRGSVSRRPFFAPAQWRSRRIRRRGEEHRATAALPEETRYPGRVLPINPTRREVLASAPGLASRGAGRDRSRLRHGTGRGRGARASRTAAARRPGDEHFHRRFADAGERAWQGSAPRRSRKRARACDPRPNSMGVVDVPGRLALHGERGPGDGCAPGRRDEHSSRKAAPCSANAALARRGAQAWVSPSSFPWATKRHRAASWSSCSPKMRTRRSSCCFSKPCAMPSASPPRRAARMPRGSRRGLQARPLATRRSARALAHRGARRRGRRARRVLSRLRIVRVDMLETLLEIAPLVAGRKPPDLERAARVAVVTTTGGGAASVVDRLGMFGIETVAPNSKSSIVDLTMTATAEQYTAVLDDLLASPQCDGVLAVSGLRHSSIRSLRSSPSCARRRTRKPLAVFLTPHAERSLALLAERGSPPFARRKPAPTRSPPISPGARPEPAARPRPPNGRPIFRVADVSTKRKRSGCLASLGIPVAKHAIAQPPGYAHAIPYPVAAKALAPISSTRPKPGPCVSASPTGPSSIARSAHCSRAFPRPAVSWFRKWNRALPRRSSATATILSWARSCSWARAERSRRLQGLRAAPCAGERRRGSGDDRAGEGAGDAARLSRPARGDARALAHAVAALSRLALVAGRPGRGGRGESCYREKQRCGRRGRARRHEGTARQCTSFPRKRESRKHVKLLDPASAGGDMKR